MTESQSPPAQSQGPLPDVIPIPDRDTLRIGLYDAASGQGVDVRNPDGSVQGDAIVIPVVLVTP